MTGATSLPAASATRPGPAVEAVGIYKQFGSTQALRGVDLILQPGRCLGLVGRNGAGKSTLVSILSGIYPADAGQVRFDGRPAPVTVDLSGVTFCDASGLGVLARISRHARQAGRQLKLASARPSLLKIMRITGLDRAFPELSPSVHAYSA